MRTDRVWKKLAHMVCFLRRQITEYISVKEAAEKWGISERRIQRLCSEDRIEGVIRFNGVWAIPKNSENHRIKESEEIRNEDIVN